MFNFYKLSAIISAVFHIVGFIKHLQFFRYILVSDENRQDLLLEILRDTEHSVREMPSA